MTVASRRLELFRGNFLPPACAPPRARCALGDAARFGTHRRDVAGGSPEERAGTRWDRPPPGSIPRPQSSAWGNPHRDWQLQNGRCLPLASELGTCDDRDHHRPSGAGGYDSLAVTHPGEVALVITVGDSAPGGEQGIPRTYTSIMPRNLNYCSIRRSVPEFSLAMPSLRPQSHRPESAHGYKHEAAGTIRCSWI